MNMREGGDASGYPNRDTFVYLKARAEKLGASGASPPKIHMERGPPLCFFPRPGCRGKSYGCADSSVGTDSNSLRLLEFHDDPVRR